MDKSPLARLPQELRLDIFERVLYAEKGVKVTLNKPVSLQRKRFSMRTYARQPHHLAIQATCKEISKDTAGLVFKVNDSWSFVAMDDDTTAWGKRVQQWCHQIAGKQCLDRARLVQLDIGAWDSHPNRRPRGSISLLLHTQIGAMYQNLPKQLRQCEQNFKLRINWSSGVRRADGSESSPSPIILIVPMWTTSANIQAAVYISIWRVEGRHRYGYFRPPTRVYSRGTPPSSSQAWQAAQDENPLEAKATQEIKAFVRLVCEIDKGCCRGFTQEHMRRRLGEHAFYP